MHQTAPLLPIKLKSTLGYYELYEACQALGIDPQHALRDPVLALRLVASSDLTRASGFLRVVCPHGAAPHLADCQSEDQARLLLAAVFAVFIEQVRRQTRGYAPTASKPSSHPPGAKAWAWVVSGLSEAASIRSCCSPLRLAGPYDLKSHTETGPGVQVNKHVDAEEIDLSPHQVADARLRNPQALGGLGLGESFTLDVVFEAHHEPGADLEVCGFFLVEAQIFEYVAAGFGQGCGGGHGRGGLSGCRMPT